MMSWSQLFVFSVLSGVVGAFTMIVLAQTMDWLEERRRRRKRNAFQGRVW